MAEYQAGRLTWEEYQRELDFIVLQIAAEIEAGAIVNADDDYYDDQAPVVTLNGDASITIELGTTYVDQGATAFDSHDGSVSVTTTGDVDTDTVGTYIITYSATDASGNIIESEWENTCVST